MRTGCLHQQGLLTPGPPPACCIPDPLWHGLSTAGWGSDPQTLLEDAAQHGAITIIPPVFSALEEGARGTEPGFLGSRHRNSPPALLWVSLWWPRGLQDWESRRGSDPCEQVTAPLATKA